MDFNRNNLDLATSPYLRQHENNPIHWQEWKPDVLEHAKEAGKLLFVSVGYSTCHWCHVMASEVFEDKSASDFLNKYFVCIKIDREQRPDIDQYLMGFLVATQGQGGWPLNVVMSPDRKPFFAATYIPISPRYNMPGFVELMSQVMSFYESNKQKLTDFNPIVYNALTFEENKLIEAITMMHDDRNGGFGSNQKFPPYNSILFLLHWYESTRNEDAKKIADQILDVMATRGLHDHLQGGFYRYCTDTQWTIPHFEKMLYDQSMLLWAYSVGYKVLGKNEYKIIVNKIITCLEETYEENNLFYSAHDADTDHHEGLTYLYSTAELKQLLTDDEYEKFSELYILTDHGNFEGKNHLVKIRNDFLPEIEEKILTERKTRPQPFTDKKIVTSWNALAGCGLVMAYRSGCNDAAMGKAKKLFDALLENHFVDGILYHSSLDGNVQKEEFLEDYSALLLFATYLHEETGEYGEIIGKLKTGIQKFKIDGRWFEARNDDFMAIPAQDYDQPTPSSVSLAELALLRVDILEGKTYMPDDYHQPGSCDFYNYMNLLRSGYFHEIHSPERIEWEKLPAGTVVIQSEIIQDCHKGSCREYESVDKLLVAIGNYAESRLSNE
jgi:hypothetical protein